MKAIRILVAVLVLLVLSVITVSAQPLGPPPSGGSTSGAIDGGSLALLVGSALYGYKQLKAVKQGENE